MTPFPFPIAWKDTLLQTAIEIQILTDGKLRKAKHVPNGIWIESCFFVFGEEVGSMKMPLSCLDLLRQFVSRRSG
jgi:hypothetical protein